MADVIDLDSESDPEITPAPPPPPRRPASGATYAPTPAPIPSTRETYSSTFPTSSPPPQHNVRDKAQPSSSGERRAQAGILPASPQPAPPAKRPPTAGEIRRQELAEKRRKRVQAAFERHEHSSFSRLEQIDILVHARMLADRDPKTDVLQKIRDLFYKQITTHAHCIENLITWRRRNSADEDIRIYMLCFAAEDYLNHLQHKSLDGCAQFIFSTARKEYGHGEMQMYFVVRDVAKEVTRRKRRAVRVGLAQGEVIVNEKCVQDSFTHLYMTYGIYTIDKEGIDQVADYIMDISDSIARLPFYRDSEFEEATLQYRTVRSRVGSARAGEGDEEDDVIVPGADLKYSYLSMLCLIPGVSANKANVIAETYPCLRQLLDAYKQCGDAQERNEMLKDLSPVGGGQRIGQSLSSKVAIAFTSFEPDELIQT